MSEERPEPRKEYTGTLRPRFTMLEDGKRVRIEWLDEETDTVIWTEEIRAMPGCSFVSQIVCRGGFVAQGGGYYIDGLGRKHHVMRCDPGKLGAIFPGGGNLEVFSRSTNAKPDIHS